eukprot:5384857-Prymnesium_polylepis.1
MHATHVHVSGVGGSAVLKAQNRAKMTHATSRVVRTQSDTYNIRAVLAASRPVLVGPRAQGR